MKARWWCALCRQDATWRGTMPPRLWIRPPQGRRRRKNSIAFEVTRAFYTVQKTRESSSRPPKRRCAPSRSNHSIAENAALPGQHSQGGGVGCRGAAGAGRGGFDTRAECKGAFERALRSCSDWKRRVLGGGGGPGLEAPPLDTPLRRPELEGVKHIQTAASAKVREANSGISRA